MNPAEYQAKRDWLRSNPHGPQAQMVKRELRAWDRELESVGVGVEAWPESTLTRLSLSPWYVAVFHDRPGQPLASKCRHRDRFCQHIANIENEDVREATDAGTGAAGTLRYLRMSAHSRLAARLSPWRPGPRELPTAQTHRRAAMCRPRRRLPAVSGSPCRRKSMAPTAGVHTSAFRSLALDDVGGALHGVGLGARLR